MNNDIKKSTLKRILSAFLALPLYCYCFTTDNFYSIPILIVSMLISLICLIEYYLMCNNSNEIKPFMLWGCLAGACVNITIYLFAFGHLFGLNINQAFDARVIFALLTIFLAIILTLQVFRRPIRGGITSLAVTVFGVIYIVFSFSHIILMKSLNDGFYYILILNIVIIINDTAAYFGGISIGRHKTNFEVSPNKSWEGYAFGIIGSVLAMIITSEIFSAYFDKHLFTLLESTILGIFLGILGHIGDLIESVIKRDSNSKDSGSIIPGHGGMWDVFDALIYTFPFFYYYLILKGIS